MNELLRPTKTPPRTTEFCSARPTEHRVFAVKELPKAPNLPHKLTVPATPEDSGANDMGKSSSPYSRRSCTLSLMLPSHVSLLLAYKREGTEGNWGNFSFLSPL
jgi:hypothetical protein